MEANSSRLKGPKRTPYTFADWEAGIDPPKGWDCADAFEDGWTAEQYEIFLRHCAEPYVPPAEEPKRNPVPKAAMLPEAPDDGVPFPTEADAPWGWSR